MSHIHRYIKIRIGERKRAEMRCAIPGCVHHIRPELAIGRLSICWNCGEEFALTKYNIRKHKHPKCINCIDTKQKKTLQHLTKLLEEQDAQS